MSSSIKRKISQSEVRKLHRICKRKDIRQLDLRIEFVDHLCELMEAHWEKNPLKSFDETFLAVYQSFGVYGFMEVAEQHRKVMAKRYYKEIMTFLRQWFTVPKIFLSISILGLNFYLCETFDAHKITLSFSGVLLLFSLVYGVYKRNIYKREFLNDETILTSSISSFFWIVYLIYFCVLNVNVGFYSLVQENSYLNTVLLGVTLIICFGTYAILEKYEDETYDLKNKLA